MTTYFYISGTYLVQYDIDWDKVVSNDVFFLCDTSSAPVNIILPNINTRFAQLKFHISDASNNASVNNINITTSGTDTINNLSSLSIKTNSGSCLIFVSCLDLNFVGSNINAKWIVLESNISFSELKFYGSFYDTTTQIASGVGTVDAMQLNSTDSSATNGISIVNDTFGNPTEITVTKTSTYNIQFSAQLYRIGGGALRQSSIWLRKNGVDVSNTNTHISVQTNSNKVVAAWNFFISLNAGDNVQLMWSVEDIDIELLYEPQNLLIPHPATPSLILTITEV
jgi:hypothetical protein